MLQWKVTYWRRINENVLEMIHEFRVDAKTSIEAEELTIPLIVPPARGGKIWDARRTTLMDDAHLVQRRYST